MRFRDPKDSEKFEQSPIAFRVFAWFFCDVSRDLSAEPIVYRLSDCGFAMRIEFLDSFSSFRRYTSHSITALREAFREEFGRKYRVGLRWRRKRNGEPSRVVLSVPHKLIELRTKRGSK